MKHSITTTCLYLSHTLLTLVGLSGLAGADQLYVDWDGTKPYTTIQAAVNDAQPGDVIVIYPGTYTAKTANSTTPDEVVYIDVEDLTIKGNGEVYIDGEGERRCIRIVGARMGQNTPIRLENLSLVNGEAVSTSGSGWTGRGGGLHVEGDVELFDCRVRDCHSDQEGGGIAIEAPNGAGFFYSSVTLSESSVETCTADGDGGGIYNGESTLVIENSSVKLNHAAGNGGGIAARQITSPWGKCEIDGLVTDNEAGKSGGGIYSFGMGLLLGGDFSGNKALDGNGGAVYVSDGRLDLADLLIMSNAATAAPGSNKGNGGAIYALRAPVGSYLFGSSLSNPIGVTFYGNESQGSGGALFAKKCEITLENVKFEQNDAQGMGGAMATEACMSHDLRYISFFNNAGAVAGALHMKNAGSGLHRLHDVSVVWNVGAMGGGLNGAALALSGATTIVEFYGCNFWQNTKKHVMTGQGATLPNNVIDLGGNGISPN
jgi:predicted outer membrane repeat protein